MELSSSPPQHTSGMQGGKAEPVPRALCLLGQEAPGNQRAATCSYKPTLDACPALCWAGSQANRKEAEISTDWFPVCWWELRRCTNQEGNRAHNWSLTAGNKELKRSTGTDAWSILCCDAKRSSSASKRGERISRGFMVSDEHYRAAGVGRGWKMVWKVQRNHPQVPAPCASAPQEGTWLRAWLRRARWKVFETAKAVSREIPLRTLLLDACSKGSASERRCLPGDLRLISPLWPWLPPAQRGSSQQFPVSHTLSHSEGTLLLRASLHLQPLAAARRLTGHLQVPQAIGVPGGRSPTTI